MNNINAKTATPLLHSKNKTSTIFHVDVNSAFLSWEACYRLNTLGDTLDLRTIPSVIGGNEEARHGIVLAKSIPAKKYGIKTGESLNDARRKCPSLLIAPPNHELYQKSSEAFIRLLKSYTPDVLQYSIDEAFMDMSGMEGVYGSLLLFAHELKEKIRNTLGFTVNIGISTNKLLAKTASDFKKPDYVHTLFPDEIPVKFWPLPVSDLLFAGPSTVKKLHDLGITTIGELAHYDINLLRLHFGKVADTLWQYANGEDTAAFEGHVARNKGYGNSTTTRFDITDADTAKHILLSLTETVCRRIRADNAHISVVSVSITDKDFKRISHQRRLLSATDVTDSIYRMVCTLFDELWDNSPIRQLGVHTSHATETACSQYNLFDLDYYDRHVKLNRAIDSIRDRYGNNAIKRASFIDNACQHMADNISTLPKQGIL